MMYDPMNWRSGVVGPRGRHHRLLRIGSWECGRVFKRLEAGVCMRTTNWVLIFLLSLAGLVGVGDSVIMAQISGQHLTAGAGPVPPAFVDPNKAPSEFNHHVAGWALIGIGLLVLASFLSWDLRALRYIWPAFFLLAGLFLAVWSDAEIWPRGNMNWAWLLHHDQEAGQHKIYALLLIAIAIVEYLRARGTLNRFWGTWTFCSLAILGAALLLVHDHTAGGGSNSPEARAYRVDPALGPDGKPPAPLASDPMPGTDHAMMDSGHFDMSMDHSSMDHPFRPIGSDSALTNTPSPDHHRHRMTPSMLLVQREHFWFMIVGLGVALFKLISDGKFWHRRFIPYVWPSGMVLLGILLVFYQE